MKSVIFGFVAMVVISAVAWMVTESQIETSGESFVSQNNSVRLD